MDRTVRINELQIRVPGLSPAEGRALGEEVARLLGEASLVGIGQGELGSLEIKVHIAADTQRADMARIVSQHILGGLRRWGKGS